MQVFEPVSYLRPYIKSFMVVESTHPVVNRLLPDTTLVAAIRLRGQVTFNNESGHIALPTFSISGLRKSYRMAEYADASANILVHFKEGGARAFLDLPMHELFESSVNLDLFFAPSALMALQEQMEAQQSIHGKVNTVQQFFISRLCPQQHDLLIAHAVEKIKTANGILSIRELSDHLYISIDAFEKRFRRVVGATPKQFSDIVRMKSLIVHTPLSHKLLDSVLDAGFFDQSHFIREFKKFTGQTPKAFLY
ncbi:helix-turn-helix transcriptional regulator [Pedobacter frigoris]|uniref:Helix-turn-helix transcriptional regulator n=1 Tax=Pedobacter frigoris TaxID=2571272 RepID=A0A4U1CDC5_9SPHI|nr:helix-turn-helix transcriptional regulator [Pedobacter frigoris]TKC04281.1 helix-turn-helix transcriptional regulator [Pedobacter frigoris]